MARDISEHYAKRCVERIVALCILKGGMPFYAELTKHLTIPLKMEFVEVKSYAETKEGNRMVPAQVSITDHLISAPFFHQHILVVDDIIDTGNSWYFLKKRLDTCLPKSLLLATLLKREFAPILSPHSFHGFEVKQADYVVGFGLDLNEQYRTLPTIHRAPEKGEPVDATRK